MFTGTRKNSMFRVNILLLIMQKPLLPRKPKFTHLYVQFQNNSRVKRMFGITP